MSRLSQPPSNTIATAPSPVIDPVEFFLKTPLYKKIRFTGSQGWDIADVIYYRGTYDAYCVRCEANSTFQVFGTTRPAEFQREANVGKTIKLQRGPRFSQGVEKLHARCTRDHNHTQYFLCYFSRSTGGIDDADFSENTLEKIGQYPSYGDVHIAEVKQYKDVLSASQRTEFTRAIRLASSDVGIGAFVYLRRILESLVEEAHQLAKNDSSWDEATYVGLRVGEKIRKLGHYLPEFFVQNAGIYSVLSKGIHELSEEECLSHFDAMRVGIELILDEKLQEKQRREKIRRGQLAIQKAIGAMKDIGSI